MVRGLLTTLILATLTACSPTPAAEGPGQGATIPPTSPAATATPPLETGGIDITSLAGRIVFDNFEDIYVMDADGTNVQQLTQKAGPEFDPMWSPDGERIVYRDSTRGTNQDDEIYVMNADGSAQTNLTKDPANDWGPAWSPDGSRIAFNSTRAGSRPQLFVMNADGSGVQQLTEQEAEYPTWSPDSTQIAFMSAEPSASGNNPNYNIYVVNADGSGITQLTDAPSEDGWPAWSPDGAKITFSTGRDDCGVSTAGDCKRSGDIGPYFDIWVMNRDGSGQTRLTQAPGQFSAWSPDGRTILFSWGQLFIVNPDGTGLTRLPLQGAGGELGFMDWSP
jgi:TolB protein